MKKGISWRVFFFWYKGRGNCCSKKNWRSRKSKIKQKKRKWKKEVKAKRDEQKQKVTKKRMRKTWVKKNTKQTREIHFQNTEGFFFFKKKERYKAIKLIKQVFVRKNAFLEWKREKRSFRKENYVLSNCLWWEKFAKENI